MQLRSKRRKDIDTDVEGRAAISNVGKTSCPTNGSYQAVRSTCHCIAGLLSHVQ
jgi:hypothetical protein